MSKWIIVPLEKVGALEDAKYASAAKDAREAVIPLKDRALWGLHGMKLIGRPDVRAIPADVLAHEAYADAVAELSKYPVEDLDENAFDVPKMEMPK